jgi:diadenosine tetraphosphatase ApaH/serine/threonine PP2A family protein phosphatase
MKYAIISDIHGNLEALQEVLSEIEKAAVDSILCLGDIVGYGPNPNECVAIVKEKAEISLAGNHDYAPLGKIDISYFNPWARSAIEWTAQELTQDSVDYLLGLPLRIELEGFTIVHSTPSEPDQWNYIVTIGDAVKNFSDFSTRVCFVGHSHVPMIVCLNGNDDYRVIEENPLHLDEEKRYIINIGSVGQPRDLDPKAAYAIWDATERLYELRRVEYDVAETQRKIRATALPDFLADRLQSGQ